VYQARIDHEALIIFHSRILGAILAALLRRSPGEAVAPMPFDLVDVKAIFSFSPPRLVIAESGLPPALEGMITSRLPGVPLYLVSPDRPVIIGKCNGLEWPLTSEQFLSFLRVLGKDTGTWPFPPVSTPCQDARR